MKSIAILAKIVVMSQVPVPAAPNAAATKPAASSGNSYDRLPYEPRPLLATHPDALATAAILAGLNPVPVTRCRVLEIGCAVGGNLLPIAQAFPESTFVGIDISAKQIAMAQRTATGAGLKNVRLEVKDFKTLTAAEFGQFDYIIAHGVYSWVQPAARDKLIPLIAQLLTPAGLAYMNYHVNPGWHVRDMFREMVAWQTRNITDPKAIAAEARTFLASLSKQATAAGESLYAAQLRQEAAFLAAVPDDYLIHEYVEAYPQAFCFEQMAEQFGRNGLAYAGEVKGNPNRRRMAVEVIKEKPELGENLAALEQAIDLAQGTFIRRSLICRTGQTVSPLPRADGLERLLIRGQILPAMTQGDVRSTEPMPFRLADGKVIEIADPAAKIILVSLAHALPRAMSFEDMLNIARVNLQLGDQFSLPGSPDREAMLNVALNCYMMMMLDLHVAPPAYVPVAGEKPKATALARFQARESKSAANVLHTLVQNLNKTERLVLAHLNGTRDRAALVGVLKAAITKGILPDPAKSPAAAVEAGLSGPLEQALEKALSRVAAEAFLIE